MLQEILDLPTSVLMFVCYVPNVSVLSVIKQYILKKHIVHNSYMETIEDTSKLKTVYRDAVIPPMLGEQWYIEVNLDKVGQDNVFTILNSINDNSVSVCYTTKYGVYKKLAENQRLKGTNMVYMLYGGRLSAKDIYITHEALRVLDCPMLTEKLLTYVIRNYRNDVTKYFEILHKLSSGVEMRTRADIVSAVGLGSLTSVSFTVDILVSDLSTENKRKVALRRWMQAVNDLLHNVDSSTLVSQMYFVCVDVYNLKNLQMQGLVVGNRREIQDEKMAQGVNRLRRFEEQIRENVPMLRILWLQRVLNDLQHRFALSEELLIQSLYMYVSCWSKQDIDERTE